MNDEAMRKAMHSAVDECFSGAEGLSSQRTKVFERIEGKAYARKISAAAVFVLLLVLALACVGVAASLGLFGQIRAGKVDEISYTRLEHLEEAAQEIAQVHELIVPGTDHAITLTIDQTYCDGRKLYYSYALKESPSQTYRSFVGDGAELPDGTSLPPVDSGYGTAEDGAATAYYEVALPEDAELGEEITFALLVMVYEDGAYAAEKSLRVPVTVPVKGDLTVLRGEGMLDEFCVKARLFISEVDIAGDLLVYSDEDDVPRKLSLLAGGADYPELERWPAVFDGKKNAMRLRFDLPQMDGDTAFALVYDGDMDGALALVKGE